MRKILIVVLALGLMFNFIFVGCGQKTVESVKQAIEIAKTLKTAEEKAKYLIAQAEAFYNSKRFQDAIDIAQYILRYVDKDSQEAKNLLEKAKDALASAATQKVEDVKKSFGIGN